MNKGAETEQYLKVTGGDALMTSAQFTIEIDLTSDGNPANGALASYGGGNEFLLYKNNDNILVYWGGPVVATYTGIGDALFDSGRHQISITVDTDTETFELFIDGVSQGTKTSTVAPLTAGGGNVLLFGQEQDGDEAGFDVAQDFEGTFHNIRIFDDIRTQPEINDNIFNDVPSGEGNLQAQWLLDGVDASGNVVDNTGNGYDIEPKDASAGYSSSGNANIPIAEDSADGTSVGSILATDPNGNSLIYSITAGNGDGIFTINASTGEITIADNTALNFEVTSDYYITVRATENGGDGFYDEGTFNVSITDVDEAPESLSLSASTIAENSANGSTIGTVSATDQRR